MKLRTLVPVTYANSSTTLITDIVEGTIIGCTEGFRFGYSVTFSFEYKGANDNYVIASKGFPLTEAEVNGLYDIVKNDVPNGLSYTDSTRFLYYCGMKIEMAAKFGILPNQIEIVTE